MSDQNKLIDASALAFTFEPPVPVGPLLGQSATQIKVIYKLSDTVETFVNACCAAVKEAYDKGRIDLLYMKEIQTRLDSLENIKKDVALSSSNLMTLCNTLGARFVTACVAELPYMRYSTFPLQACTNYQCVITMQRALYNAAKWASETDYMHEEQMAQAYMAVLQSLSTTDKYLNTRFPNNAEAFEFNTVLKGFIGIYHPGYTSVGDMDVHAEYASELEAYYSDEESDDDCRDAKDATAVRVCVGEYAILDEYSPLALIH